MLLIFSDVKNFTLLLNEPSKRFTIWIEKQAFFVEKEQIRHTRIRTMMILRSIIYLSTLALPRNIQFVKALTPRQCPDLMPVNVSHLEDETIQSVLLDFRCHDVWGSSFQTWSQVPWHVTISYECSNPVEVSTQPPNLVRPYVENNELRFGYVLPENQNETDGIDEATETG